jgi:fatty acid desaturase
MRALVAWLLFLILVAWSGLVGALAGYGAVAARRWLPDSATVGLAVLLVFGLALVLGGRSLPVAWVLAGIAGFAAIVPVALRHEGDVADTDVPDRESADVPRSPGSGAPAGEEP